MRGGIEDRARVIVGEAHLEWNRERSVDRKVSFAVFPIFSPTSSRTFTFAGREGSPRWVDPGARRSRARRGCRELDASRRAATTSPDEDRRPCSRVSPFGCAASCHGSIAGRTPATSASTTRASGSEANESFRWMSTNPRSRSRSDSAIIPR